MSIVSHVVDRLRRMERTVLGRMRRISPRRSDEQYTHAIVAEPLEPRLLLSGTSYVVDSLQDVVASDGVVTLREAIQAANTNTAVTRDVLAGSVGSWDRISFDVAALRDEAGTGNSLVIALTQGQLTISDVLWITGPGAEVLTIDAGGVSRVLEVRDTASLSGLTITGGKVTGSQWGAGLYASKYSVLLAGMAIVGNVAAGDAYGGGIYNEGHFLTLEDTTVSGNTAAYGGGICIGDGTVTLRDSAVSGNSASENGGGIWHGGGASLRTDSTTIRDNTAATYGGGMFFGGSEATLMDTTVTDNTADWGGGIRSWGGALTLVNTTLRGNFGYHGGGGIDNYAAELTLTNTAIVDNVTRSNGGGIDNATGAVDLMNSTVAGNSAHNGGGVFNYRGTLTLANTVVALNGAVWSDDIRGGFSSSGSFIGADDGDPGFMLNPGAGPDGQWRTDDDLPGWYRLAPDSPLIDAGDSALLPTDRTDIDDDDDYRESLPEDLVGRARVQGATVDIGAYEGSHSAGTSIAVVGPETVQEGQAIQLQATVSFAEEAVFDVTSRVTWSTDSEFASITADGALSVGYVSAEQTVSVIASLGDVSDAFDVTLEDLGNALISLALTGPLTVVEQGSASYVLTAAYEDGTTPDVTDQAAWQSSVEEATVAAGVLTVPDIAGDSTATLTASFGGLSAEMAVDLDATGTLYIVNSLADTVSDDDVVTLREALQAANANAAVTADVLAGDADSNDMVAFDLVALQAEAGVGNPLVIALTEGQLEITESLTITGPGADGLIVDAQGASRVLHVSGNEAYVELSGLTITGGSADGDGGGIRNWTSSLRLTNMAIRGNEAIGLYPCDGGGVCNDGGTLTLVGTVVSENTARHSGGGVANKAGTLTLVDTVVSGNETQYAYRRAGGGVYSLDGTVSVTHTTVSDNTAGGAGGGIFSSGGPLTLTDATIADNESGGGGGGISSGGGPLELTDSTVSGNKAGSDDYDHGGGIHSNSGTLMNTVVRDNTAGGAGGGIYGYDSHGATLALTDTLVTNNTSGNGGGGGICLQTGVVQSEGSLTLSDCTVSGNTASGPKGYGGGIYGASGDALTLTDTRIWGNTASYGGGGIGSFGGLLELMRVSVWGNRATIFGGGIVSTGGGMLADTTVSSNQAGYRGGGIYSVGVPLTLTNTTVAANTAGDAGGGAFSRDGVLVASNTIVAGNEAPAGADIDGVCVGSRSLVGVDPGFVRDPANGGDGWGDDPATGGTDESLNDDYGDLHLLDISPAIDMGDNALAVDGAGEPLTVDLDGTARVANGTVDIGAYEYVDAPSPLRDLGATVTTLTDTADPADGEVSLREALVHGALLGDAVTFDASLAGGTIALAGGEIYLCQPVTVDATGIGGLVVDAGGRDQAVHVASATVTMLDVVVTGGAVAVSGGGVCNLPAYADLEGSIVDAAMPAAILSGSRAKLKLTVGVGNRGTIAMPNKQTIDIRLYVRPVGAADASSDLLVATITRRSISRLASGETKLFKIRATLPETLPDGQYHLVASIDDPDQVAEPVEGNNVALADTSIIVGAAHVDLIARVEADRASYPMVSGVGMAAKLTVHVTNQGSAALPKKQTIDIGLYARPADAADAGQDVLVANLTGCSASRLAPGRTKKIKAVAEFPATLGDGDYVLVAVTDSADQVSERDETNNEAFVATVSVGTPHVDLVGRHVGGDPVPETVVVGAPSSVAVEIELVNQGNVAAAVGDTITIGFYARPIGAIDGVQDVAVYGAARGVSVEDLGAGQAKTVRTTLILPSYYLGPGDYTLVAKIDPPRYSGRGDVDERDETNNDVPIDGAVSVVPAFRDYGVELSPTARLPEMFISNGVTAISLPVTVKNVGNVPIEAGEVASFSVYVRPADAVDDSQDSHVYSTPYQTMPFLPADGAKGKKLKLKFTPPSDLSSGDYRFVVRTHLIGSNKDASFGNNRALTPAITIDRQPGPPPKRLSYVGSQMHAGNTISDSYTDWETRWHKYNVKGDPGTPASKGRWAYEIVGYDYYGNPVYGSVWYGPTPATSGRMRSEMRITGPAHNSVPLHFAVYVMDGISYKRVYYKKVKNVSRTKIKFKGVADRDYYISITPVDEGPGEYSMGLFYHSVQ